MKKDHPHPLQAWLDAHDNLSVHAFAQAKKIPWRVIYRHMEGELTRPDVTAMDRIATATDGAVTIQDQVDWFKKKAKRRARS